MTSMTRSGLAVAIVAALAPGLTGCARIHARTEPALPPMVTPAPPPHEVAPAPVPAPAPSGPEEDVKARPQPPVHRPARPEPAEPSPAIGSRPSGTKSAAPPAPTLQTAPSATDDATVRGIRDTLSRAGTDLGQVDYRSLSADAKAQYQTARRFIRQAEEALKTHNYVFARSLADKAAVLAALLQGGL